MGTRMRLLIPAYLVALLFLIGAAASQTGIPPFPAIYQGSVTVAGIPAPDGTEIVAHIEDFKSGTVRTRDGRYATLVVGPTDYKYVDKEITFHIRGVMSTEQAIETDIFVDLIKPTVKTVDLTFAKLPPVPTPIPPFVGDFSLGRLPYWALAVGLLSLSMGLMVVNSGGRGRNSRA